MGSTNPLEAKDGTIRKAYGLNIQENSVHGSDSLDNANKEIKYFFDEDEIFVNLNNENIIINIMKINIMVNIVSLLKVFQVFALSLTNLSLL